MTYPFRQRCTARCAGKSRPDLAGKPCRAWAVQGATVCRMHGGASKQAKTKAKERLLEREVLSTAARLAGAGKAPTIDNALEALAKLAGEILSVKDLFRERLADLDGNSWRYSGQGAEQLRAEVALYERAMDRSVSVLGTISRLKIDERLARIQEEQGQAVVTVLSRVAARMGLDLDDPVIRAMVLEEIERAEREAR